MAQRQRSPRCERYSFRQTAKTRRDPGAVALREILRIGEIAARRHGQDSFTAARMNAQRISSRAPMPPQLNRVDRSANFDCKRARLGGTTIKKGAKSHVSRSEGENDARILPYPPPRKSTLAKTNHLPNIS
jgi:hypothetical protein